MAATIRGHKDLWQQQLQLRLTKVTDFHRKGALHTTGGQAKSAEVLSTCLSDFLLRIWLRLCYAGFNLERCFGMLEVI